MPPKRKWKGPSLQSSSEATDSTQKLTPEELYAKALKLLARRAFPTRELERKLQLTCPDSPTVERVIERLKTSGYLNDRKFAEAFIQSRLRKAQGRARIERDLRSRELNPRLIREELEKAYPAEAETEPLQNALEHRLRSLVPPMDAKKVSRLYNHLLRRGFPGEAIRQELRRRLKVELYLDQVE